MKTELEILETIMKIVSHNYEEGNITYPCYLQFGFVDKRIHDLKITTLTDSGGNGT